MIWRLKENWHRFTESEPGCRFVERYRHRSANSKLSRMFTLLAGVVMFLVGLASMPLLLPADGLLIPLGLLLIASEVKLAAQLFDWAELKARRASGRASKISRNFSVGKAPVVVAGAAVLMVALTVGIAVAASG